MATIRAVIVDPDGTIRATEIEASLGSYQAVVGGYIEGVFGNVATIYVNEEGLLRSLPINPSATLFATRILGHAGMRLFGTALIVGPPSEGDDTPVRPAVVDYFTKGN
jgi:Domain of unknown function (DUF3846)